MNRNNYGLGMPPHQVPDPPTDSDDSDDDLKLLFPVRCADCHELRCICVGHNAGARRRDYLWCRDRSWDRSEQSRSSDSDSDSYSSSDTPDYMTDLNEMIAENMPRIMQELRLGKRIISETEKESDVIEAERAALNAEPVNLDELYAVHSEEFLMGERCQFEYLKLDDIDHCLVRLGKSLPVYKKLETYLLQNFRRFPIVEFPLRDIFLVRHKGVWYRARMNRRKGRRVVDCIDTGESIEFVSQQCRKVPDELSDLPPFVFGVYITRDSMLRLPSQGLMKVQVVDLRAEGDYEVRVLRIGRETPPLREPKRSRSGRSHVTDYLTVGMCGVFVALDVHDPTMTGYLILDEVDEALISHRHMSSLRTVESARATAYVGHMIAVNDPDDDTAARRGIIRSTSDQYGYEVALVDTGNAVFTDRIYLISKMTTKLTELGCKVTMRSTSNSSLTLIPNTNYYFEVKANLKEGRWFCLFKTDNESEEYEGEGILEKISRELHKIRYVPFNSGCNVIVSALTRKSSDICVHIRRWDQGSREGLSTINAEVRSLPEPEDYDEYSRNLHVGDFVAAKQPNGNSYRAMVLAIRGENVRVSVLDYGNEATVKITDLKPLTHNLIEAPVYSREIKLLGPKDAISAAGYRYLEALLRNREELILSYDEFIEKGVLLIEKGMQVVNPRLFGDVAILAKSELDQYSHDFFTQCVYTPGRIDDLVILHVDKTEFMTEGVFWIYNPNNSEIDDELMDRNRQIGDYCRMQRERYYPSNGELCFALYQGLWYRGFVTEVFGRECEVFFVDYGRTLYLEPSSLRRMNVEYFILPPLAMKCVLQGFTTFTKLDINVAYDYLRERVGGFTGINCYGEILEVKSDTCMVEIPELTNHVNIRFAERMQRRIRS